MNLALAQMSWFILFIIMLFVMSERVLGIDVRA
jgi:hypothetical protein